MKKQCFTIDIFVTIVDNFGDMWFAYEFIVACQREFGDAFQFVIWTNDVWKVRIFFWQAGILEADIVNIEDFWFSRKSAIWISLLHSSIPDLSLFTEKALILRIDYLSMDPIWIENNEKEHIISTKNRQVIELIPSPIIGGAGLIPLYSYTQEIGSWSKKHITLFVYEETLACIDWESFPDDIIVYVFWRVNSIKKNIISLDYLSVSDFYSLIDSSQFVIIRGEVSFAHIIQRSVPFFWDIYKNIGWFPSEQSEQFLSIIDANQEYRKIHQIINGQRLWRVTYKNLLSALSCTHFSEVHTKNLIHTVKKYIDRFHNSI